MGERWNMDDLTPLYPDAETRRKLLARMQKMGPKRADHPTIGVECPACGEGFAPGDFTCLLVLGPGADPEARRLCREMRAYTAKAIEVHWGCATGEEETGILVVGPEGMPR